MEIEEEGLWEEKIEIDKSESKSYIGTRIDVSIGSFVKFIRSIKMYSKEEIKLAPKVVEALEKLGEKECSQCKGTGEIKYQLLNRNLIGNTNMTVCFTCNGTGKVGGWKWEPRRGQFAQIGMGMIVLVDRDGLFENKFVETSDMGLIEIDRLTPFLHWETIEKILEKAGYMTRMDEETWAPDKQFKIWDTHKKGFDEWSYPNWREKGKTRQLAVMKAVIALWKKVK